MQDEAMEGAIDIEDVVLMNSICSADLIKLKSGPQNSCNSFYE